MAKSRRLELGGNIATATYLASKEIEIGEKRQIRAITPFRVIQGHPRLSRSEAIERPYATSYSDI